MPADPDDDRRIPTDRFKSRVNAGGARAKTCDLRMPIFASRMTAADFGGDR
jgi:hypothetical protein